MIQKLKDYDFTLIITPILLAAFGMVMIYSASMVTSIVEGYESTHYLIKQLQWFVIGLAGFIFCSIFPYKYYQKLMKIIILFVILLLVGVLFFGTTINNAKSWFSFGPISLQPAEFAKLALIMYLASVYSKKQAYINEFTKGVLPPLVLTGIILSLIVLQPDIGTASIIFLIACSVIFSAGIRFKHLFLLIGIGLVILAIAIPNMVTDVRISRFTGAYQPFQTPEDGGYHLIQSYLAIGGGGFTGEGLGQSVQKLGYLMEAHTDFIMAIIAEELGFMGVMIVIGMIATIVLRGIFISSKCQDSFGSLLAIGISSMIGLQAFINLGAISGVLPITGVPLPFVSYGGSSLLVLMISMGIMNNIAMSVKTAERTPVSEHKKTEPHIYQNRGGRTWQK
ncbi:putative lipid II flippase FtsW [Virgibacillus sp. SK37]|uniref:putative lipid II flippase FtsW n=1 Tax=Virgibacillus sp. SK37 TaxID=403957 RepID=UPI0004D102AF|nr:putative lipid II flippase FtsW [Virgibacillus sp. SK37]AIF43880.1 cell division protein FtsW [Virgibacillus sp. SK37]